MSCSWVSSKGPMASEGWAPKCVTSSPASWACSSEVWASPRSQLTMGMRL